MKLQSKKVLATVLAEFDASGTTAKVYSYETYGSRTMAYIAFTSNEERKRGEDFLERKGFKVFRAYSPGSHCTEVQVSYFKAHGWNA